MDMEKIYRKALALDFLTADEALVLYESGPLDELMSLAWELRQKHVPGRTVTWQIDRNVNITNVCISGCKFCNFHCKPYDRERAYVTTIDQYVRKIDETLALGGDQLLLQGGLHPKLGIDFYENLFRELKRLYPTLKLHALGAPEVAHIARISSLDDETTLRRLMDAHVSESTLNEYGRYDDLISTVNKAKARAYFESVEGVRLPPPKVLIKTDKLLRSFILNGGMDIS